MKDTGLRIRVQRDLRDRFVHVCQAQDKPAAQVLREFMRTYVDEHQRDKPAAQVLREFMRTYVDEHQALLANDPPTSSGPKAKGG